MSLKSQKGRVVFVLDNVILSFFDTLLIMSFGELKNGTLGPGWDKMARAPRFSHFGGTKMALRNLMLKSKF